MRLAAALAHRVWAGPFDHLSRLPAHSRICGFSCNPRIQVERKRVNELHKKDLNFHTFFLADAADDSTSGAYGNDDDAR
jgi:hypothetical protein